MNLNLIKKHHNPRKILDIGAHFGEFYEMCFANFGDIEQYVAIEGNIECEPILKLHDINYHIALLGDEETTKNFYKRKTDTTCTGSSLYREMTPHFSDNDIIVEKKEIKTLDNLFTSDDYFDFIKIDTQGSEIDILRGGSMLCRKASIILLEVSVLQYNEGSPLYPEVVSFMEEFGFLPAEIISTNRYPDNTPFQHDILFKKNNK